MARPPSGSGDGSAPSITVAIPLDALPAVTVTAPPPALVTKRNASHVGMTGPELVRVLRAMRADPRFRDAVVAHGKSYRAASPESIIAYLRAAPVVKDGDEGGDDLLRELGYERTGTGARCAPSGPTSKHGSRVAPRACPPSPIPTLTEQSLRRPAFSSIRQESAAELAPGHASEGKPEG